MGKEEISKTLRDKDLCIKIENKGDLKLEQNKIIKVCSKGDMEAIKKKFEDKGIKVEEVPEQNLGLKRHEKLKLDWGLINWRDTGVKNHFVKKILDRRSEKENQV